MVKIVIYYYHFFPASENDSKISNISEENRTKDESDKLTEPSECKIPKTEDNEAKESKSNDEQSEVIEVKVVYNKKKYDVSAPSNTTIADFKKILQGLLGIK